MSPRSKSGTAAKILALLMAFALFAVACGDDSGDGGSTDTDDTINDDDASQADDTETDGGVGEDEDKATEDIIENEPVRDGVLRIGVEAQSDGLNPTANNFAQAAYMMGYAIYDPLFYVDSENNWFPWLAESAEPVGDGSSWDVTVRQGVTFHDGTPFNAAALGVNFDRTLADPLISLAVKPSYPEENRWELIDEYTIRYNLIRPSQHFPVNLTSQLGFIASPAYLELQAEDEGLDQFPVGTGPFEVTQREVGVKTTMTRFDGYWQGTDDIYLASIEIHPNTDSVISAERVGSGELDMVTTSNPEAQLTLEDLGIDTTSNLFAGEDDIMMNTSRPPFDDLRVRQALTFAADREGYHEIIAQGTKPLADTFFHPGLKWHNPEIVQEGNTPDLAAPLIVDYCSENPVNAQGDPMCTNNKVNMELQYSGPSVTQTLVMDVLSEGWEDYFNITRQELLQTAHITDVAFGAYDVVTWRQFGAVDPDNEVIWLECATAGEGVALNWVRVCNPERDELLFAQRATADEAERIALWQEIAQDVHDSYAYIFTTHANWVVGFNDNVKNLCGTTGPDGQDIICNNAGALFLHNAWVE